MAFLTWLRKWRPSITFDDNNGVLQRKTGHSNEIPYSAFRGSNRPGYVASRAKAEPLLMIPLGSFENMHLSKINSRFSLHLRLFP